MISETPTIIFIVAAGYLLGSFPAGYVAGRVAGIDIQKCGSGNIGATNVLRTLGKKYGYAVLLFDVLKGVAAVLLARLVAARFAGERTSSDWFEILAATSCVVGHTFPVWLKFKGGKGVATSGGVMLALAPVPTFIALLVWLVVFELSRYVSIASMAAVLTLPTVLGLCLQLGIATSRPIFFSAIVLAIIVCWRHRSNISRLLHGNERRFTRR